MPDRARTEAAMTKVTRTESKSSEEYVLRLYVAGVTPRSVQAIENVKSVCERHLQGRYELQVIDIYQQPVLAKGDQIIAVPTLIKSLPVPLRTLIGDLSDVERVLVGLDLRPRPSGNGEQDGPAEA
jgi:circadian clock protein KaiB